MSYPVSILTVETVGTKTHKLMVLLMFWLRFFCAIYWAACDRVLQPETGQPVLDEVLLISPLHSQCSVVVVYYSCLLLHSLQTQASP